MTVKELITILKRFPKTSTVKLESPRTGEDIQVTAHVNENDEWVIVIAPKEQPKK